MRSNSFAADSRRARKSIVAPPRQARYLPHFEMAPVESAGDLRPEIAAALERRGITELTPVQKAVLEAGGADRNVRISSQTGSGKTVAVGLAIAPDLLDHLDDPREGPLALVITPTRELAAQVCEELSWLFGESRAFRSEVVTGGTDLMRERKALKRRPHLLVGTPGRLLDHMRARAVNFESLRHVALDEADQMLDMGFREELEAIIDQLPTTRRSHLVSATFPRAVRDLADAFQDDPLHLEGTELGAANEDIAHVAHLVGDRDRYAALVNALLLLDGARCLVFVQRRADTVELAEALAGDGFSALPFSGDLTQAQRTRTLNAFRTGVVSTIVATDVAARGIDVADIEVVVHMDLPRRPEDYVHRSGRTGRAGKQGRSIALVTPRARHHARWLFDASNSTVSWSPLPTAKKIDKTLVKRWRRKLFERLAEDAPEPSETQLEYAARLLETQSPDRLVACLLDLAQPAPIRAPIDIEPVDPQRLRNSRPERRGGPGRPRPGRGGGGPGPRGGRKPFRKKREG